MSILRAARKPLGLAALLLVTSLPVAKLLAVEPQSPAAAPTVVQRVSERVFLIRDQPGSPTQFKMIVGAGSAEETRENAGIAHYLEHLVLVGSNPENATIGMRFFAGGQSNGSTYTRTTTYEHTAPARAEGPRADLEKLFQFYAARLKDFSITDADAARELKVVLQEYDLKIRSKPYSRFAVELNRAALPDHSGNWYWRETREDIERNTVEAAREFHRTWYAPNNVSFIVQGDIEPAALKQIADAAFAGIQEREVPARDWMRQPTIVAERTDIRRTDPDVKQDAIYYKKVVRIEDKDALATMAAAAVIESFLASKLPGSPFHTIVEKGKLPESGTSISLARIAPNTYVLDISASVAAGLAPEQLLGALSDYVDALAQNGISARTIERLKTRWAIGQAERDQTPHLAMSDIYSWLTSAPQLR